MKRVIISATSDIATDQRVRKVALTLHDAGYAVVVVGREKRDSMAVEDLPFEVVRFRLPWEAGPLFYAAFNLRLFSFLMSRKADVFNANDLDTLLACFCASLIRRTPIVYDCHEYFMGIPEIQQRPAVKNTWKAVERTIFPRLTHIYTVNESIARLYEGDYGKPVRVIRNLPPRRQDVAPISRAALGLPENKHLLILQGTGINVDRGAEEAVEAMRYVDDALLLIIGSGDVFPRLESLLQQHGLQDRVRLMGKMPWESLMQYTAAADLGLTLDKDTNINYRYSLPNKLFDYIKAGTPVLASRLVEVEKVVRGYDIGSVVESHDPRVIATRIREILGDAETLDRWHRNLERANEELAWEAQVDDLLSVYRSAAGQAEVPPGPVATDH